MSQVFYHYTTLEGFYSIIKDRQLLLTSLNNMNDPVEGSYSVEEFLSDIAEIVLKHSSSEPYLKDLQDAAMNNKMNLYKKIEESWNTKLTDTVEQWHRSSGLSEKQFIKLSIIRACRYLKLEEVWSSSLIPEILIGPFSRQNSDDLKAFIESSGLDLARTVVKKSDIKIQ